MAGSGSEGRQPVTFRSEKRQAEGRQQLVGVVERRGMRQAGRQAFSPSLW